MEIPDRPSGPGGWARKLLYDGPRAVCAALFLVGLFLNCANVIGRYVFLRPIMSAEEVLVYLMIWCIFLGAALVTYDGTHLRMDLLTSRLPAGARRLLEQVAAVVFLVIAVTMVSESAGIVRLVSGMDEKSVVARIPMEVPYAALPASFALMALAVVWRLVALRRGADSPGPAPHE